jgi:hypothetical protein
VGFVLDADDAVLGQSAHAGEQELGISSDQHWPPCNVWVQAPSEVVIHRQHVVAGGLDQPQALQFMQLLRHLL